LSSDADANAWRLVGWSESVIEGVEVTPEPDRVRGFTLVIVNLKAGPAPDPNSGRYNVLNSKAEPVSVPETKAAAAKAEMDEFIRIHGGITLPLPKNVAPGSGSNSTPARKRRALP
ncbi:MAG: hypothetical protein ACKO85_19535, partial [Isosphaeraceae bacterium]